MSLSRDIKWTRLLNKVSGILTDVELYMSVYHVDLKQAESAINMMTELKDMAARGDADARNNIIDYYVRVLSSGKLFDADKETVGIINFDNILDNEPQIVFEFLLENRRLGEMIDKYHVENVLTWVELREIVRNEDKDDTITRRYKSKRERCIFLSILLYAFAYGQDCIDSLQNQDINEIGVLNKDYVYITYKGRKIRLVFLSFDSVGTILNIQKKTTQNSSLNYDRQNPIVVTSKNNFNRISVAGYEVTPSTDDAYYNERIFNLKNITLEEMRDKYNTINDGIYRFLIMNQAGRGSFFVTGSDMGVGKSTFLLSMLEKYPDSWGIGILDPQNELQVSRKYPSKNVITLVENDKKNLSECFAYLLKTSRDVLCVSEITMPEEVAELVNSALRLNAGVCATMHSFSPQEVVPNLRNLMLRTSMYNDKNTAEEDIAGSIDLIIHLGRLKDGRIKVMSIHEICIDREDCEFGSNVDDMREMEKKLYILGIKALKDLVLGRRYHLREIVCYDMEREDWVFVEPPSDFYLDKLARYASSEVMEEGLSIFEGSHVNG